MIKIEYLVDICGNHDAPVDTLIDEIQQKEFEDPYKAVEFLNCCTHPLNINNVLKLIECDYSLYLKEDLLLDKKEFVKFDELKLYNND